MPESKSCGRLDDALGGGSCLDAGAADLRLVKTLLRDGRYSSEIGRQMFSMAAALGRFTGWAAFDAGRHAAAQRFWHASLRAAAAAGQVDQGVYVLSNLALQAIYADDASTALGLLDVARRKVDPAARTVLAMLDCWAARSHALAGDTRTAAKVLNRADNLWGQRRPEDDPTWVYWMPQPSLTAEAGTALMDMGDLAAAERALTDGLATLDAESVRERNLYLVRLAETQLRGGRLDEAAATAGRAIDSIGAVESARIRQRMRLLFSQMPANEKLTVALREHQRDDC
jgi:hypothetical protein